MIKVIEYLKYHGHLGDCHLFVKDMLITRFIY